jgi:hypothetical protein
VVPTRFFLSGRHHLLLSHWRWLQALEQELVMKLVLVQVQAKLKVEKQVGLVQAL